MVGETVLSSVLIVDHIAVSHIMYNQGEVALFEFMNVNIHCGFRLHSYK